MHVNLIALKNYINACNIISTLLKVISALLAVIKSTYHIVITSLLKSIIISNTPRATDFKNKIPIYKA